VRKIRVEPDNKRWAQHAKMALIRQINVSQILITTWPPWQLKNGCRKNRYAWDALRLTVLRHRKRKQSRFRLTCHEAVGVDSIAPGMIH